MNTPFLPALRAALAPLGSRTAHAVKTLGVLTLCQLEDRFGGCLPSSLFPKNPVKIADGSTVTLPDTPKNRKAYPPLHSPEPNFPMLRIAVLFSLLSGAILSVVCGDLRTAELPMLAQLLGQLAQGDILLGDRGF